jgi:hypothetical protein
LPTCVGEPVDQQGHRIIEQLGPVVMHDGDVPAVQRVLAQA